MSKAEGNWIKVTQDGKFHTYGLVVDTIEEAIQRCKDKNPDSLTYHVTDRESDPFGFGGNEEFILEWVNSMMGAKNNA